MEKTITIPLELYNRLSTLAHGFDTPADVISRLVDSYVGGHGEAAPVVATLVHTAARQSSSLEIVLSPENEEDFKKAFLSSGVATVKIYKIDNSCTVSEWKLNKFSPSSSVKGNLLSGRLRGWREKGIYKAEVIVAGS